MESPAVRLEKVLQEIGNRCRWPSYDMGHDLIVLVEEGLEILQEIRSAPLRTSVVTFTELDLNADGLLPCPFCGADATYLGDRVSCDACLCEVRKVKNTTRADLTAAWNRRLLKLRPSEVHTEDDRR